MGNEKLEKLRLELAIGEEQANRGEFVEDYNLEDLLGDLDNEASFFTDGRWQRLEASDST